ncbi:expressed unknown protein [Seminavis robusta]|uniref:Uncharacterized protein n=1 Tax=Seminavis robusta TaxID=568900 RepID=A0A9N8DXR5_9STRA|nr:expressed unknown protein [Seminavis robusta]|eukprot:Sro457_g146840.1 n/a (266) ;mRNA; f:27449-28246
MDSYFFNQQQSRPRGKVVLCLSMLASCALAFQPELVAQPLHPGSSSKTARAMAAIDPTEVANAVSSIHHHTADASTWDAFLSTMYSATNLHPAHGHSNPLFGPPDPYISAGKSIAPNIKAFMTDTTTATVPEQLPEIAKVAAQKGVTIVDASKFQAGGGDVLPGFHKMGGVFGRRTGAGAHGNLQVFQNQVANASKLQSMLNHMIFPAFAFLFVDFLFLRPDSNVYQEDIEEEPVDAIVDSVQAAGVRLGVFVAMSFFATMFFSG